MNRRRSDHDLALALALALAFSAAEWTVAGLTTAGQRTVGSRTRWLRLLAQDMLACYPEVPADRPRELTAVIAGSEPFLRGVEAARASGRPLRVVAVSPAGTRMVPGRWDVPVLHDVVELAAWLELSVGQLLWLADPAGRQRREAPGPLHLYDYRWVPRRAGPPRLLEAPTPILKRVQRRLLTALLGRIAVHDDAHGFVPGRSVLTHARRHLGAQVVLTLDLQDFFASITPGRLYGTLRLAGYPEPVAHLLTGLCSTRTPVRVLTEMLVGGADQARFALRSRLRASHLPQGAPTSPVVANLACFALDRRLSGYANAFGATYSRYADDLTFSGDAQLSLATTAAVAGIGRIVASEGFRTNPAKTRVQRRSGRQLVTGVVVNERPNVTRHYYDQLRAVLHEAATSGPVAANRHHHPEFRQHLEGRVEWVESVNPGRGRRLRRDLAAVVWPGD